MKSAVVISMVAALAAATPSGSRHNLHPRDAELCAAASNCEIYDTPEGTRLRFRRGMEPGTAAYNSIFTPGSPANVKRDDVHTQVTVGKSTINYGSISPPEALKHLTEACPDSGSCDTTPVQVVTTRAQGNTNLDITAAGSYGSSTDRDNFVSAIVTAVGLGTTTKKETFCTQSTVVGQPVSCNNVDVNSQTNFVGVNRFDNGNLQGFMTATMALEKIDDKWCAIALGIFNTLVGQLNGLAGGFLGTIDKPICQ